MGLKLPDAFIKRMQETLPDESEQFLEALDGFTPVSVRFNAKRKNKKHELEIESSVPWENNAFYLTKRPSFTYDPSFHAGLYYVQEASSMFIGQILDQLPGKKEWELAIDLCAAPGGKSTHLLSKLPEQVFLLANEVTSQRLGALRQNIIKWGYSNAAVINYSVETIAGTGIEADLLLVDAPCSGEGLFRKDPESIHHWNAANLTTCENRQKDILNYAPALLKENGYLIYSTCTYNPGENMEQIRRCVDSGYFTQVDLNFNENFQLKELTEAEVKGYQCYPHKVRGEGFFFACLQRTDKQFNISETKNYKPDSTFRPLYKDEKNLLPYFLADYSDNIQVDKEGNYFYAPDELKDLQHYMNIRPLFELGMVKGKDFIPGHGLAMLELFSHIYPKVELSHADSIKFLKKESFQLDNNEQLGWHFVTYGGNNLGLIKILNNRINNYFPTNLRILK